jgi:hypothetical protein
METLDGMKEQWKSSFATNPKIDDQSWNEIIRKKMKSHKNKVMQYFWTSFVFQLIAYGMLTHVLVRYGNQRNVLIGCVIGITLFIPFTVMLMQKFKRLAVLKKNGLSVSEFISTQIRTIEEFFVFKKRYEWILIPVSAALGVYLTFEVFSPGTILNHLYLATIIYLISISSCAYAINVENRKNFSEPIKQLRALQTEIDNAEERRKGE